MGILRALYRTGNRGNVHTVAACDGVTSKYLLDNAFAPLTFEWGFFEAPFEKVVKELVQWRECHCSKVSTSSVSGSLPALLPQLQPLTVGETRSLLLETPSPWVAYFGNNQLGGEVSAPVKVVSERLGCRALVFMACPNTLTGAYDHKPGVYGVVGFELYSPENTQQHHRNRAVIASNDGGRWEFYTDGDPLPFERLECYTARRVKDRLTPELLGEYGTASGLRLMDPGFYGPVGALVTLKRILPPGASVLSLRQVQKKMGFR